MFLHLGKGHMILSSRIVMIGDIDSSLHSKITQNFINMCDEEGFIVDYSSGEPRSFILTEETIYYSLISSRTLEKRVNNFIGNSQ